jgi:general secretion pathway protein E
VIRLVNLVIRTVHWTQRASDIHIEPFESRLIIRYRVDGVMNEVESPPNRLSAAVISRIKIMANLDIAERRLPQDGRIKLRALGKEIDMRVSTVPTMHGESVVMRILDKGGVQLDFNRLGFEPDTLKIFLDVLMQPARHRPGHRPDWQRQDDHPLHGPEKLNKPDIKILTVEDPVEYQMEGVNQIQVKPQIGLTFANALRSIVRQDPDVIMIGEIRDLETAQIAVQSALTGHMVLSTLHTNDAPSTVNRLARHGRRGLPADLDGQRHPRPAPGARPVSAVQGGLRADAGGSREVAARAVVWFRRRSGSTAPSVARIAPAPVTSVVRASWRSCP